MSYQYTNNASTTLSTGITAGATSITVSTGTGNLFPVLSGSNVFRGTLVDSSTQTLREIVQVTSTAGDTFTITRAQEGTLARAYNAGDIFYLDLTAGQISDFFSKTYDSFPPQTGRLIGTQIITATGTYTPTTGTNSIIFQLVGAGGGGGSTQATGGGQLAMGVGGGGGGVVIHRATSGFSGQTVTIGAGGTGGTAGSSGGNGGTSTFLGCSAFGGLGGTLGPAAAATSLDFTVPGGAATGGNILNSPGSFGGAALYVFTTSGNIVFGGEGGNNILTSRVAQLTSGGGIGTGMLGQLPGGGGGGAKAGLGGLASRAGGTGANGICIIYEYS